MVAVNEVIYQIQITTCLPIHAGTYKQPEYYILAVNQR